MNYPDYNIQGLIGPHPPLPNLNAPCSLQNAGFRPPRIGFNLGSPMHVPGFHKDTDLLATRSLSYSATNLQRLEDSNKLSERDQHYFNSFEKNSNFNSHEDLYRPISPSGRYEQSAASNKKKRPTVVPHHPFYPFKDAEALRVAMKGFGTDERAIMNILTKRSNAQRLEIASHFKTLYGKDIIKELKSEISGNFEKIVIALMTPIAQYYAKELYGAIVGLGTDEAVLIEILCILNNEEIRAVKEAYQKTYRKNLVSDLKGDTSGHFKRLMISLCNAGRDENTVTDLQAATADAKALHNAGDKRSGTDLSVFSTILCQRNYAQLRLIFQEFLRITGHDIEKSIKREFSGDMEDALLTLVRSVKNRPAFFAHRLRKCVKGLEINHSDIIRIVVTRCEIDMEDIKKEFKALYKETLAAALKHESSGDYRKCLLALIGER